MIEIQQNPYLIFWCVAPANLQFKISTSIFGVLHLCFCAKLGHDAEFLNHPECNISVRCTF
jgi:hypothetical protein